MNELEAALWSGSVMAVLSKYAANWWPDIRLILGSCKHSHLWEPDLCRPIIFRELPGRHFLPGTKSEYLDVLFAGSEYEPNIICLHVKN